MMLENVRQGRLLSYQDGFKFFFFFFFPFLQTPFFSTQTLRTPSTAMQQVSFPSITCASEESSKELLLLSTC